MDTPDALRLDSSHAGHPFLPSRLRQLPSGPGSTSSEDPLTGEPTFSRSQSPAVQTQVVTVPTDTLLSPPSRQRIAVVLSASPGTSGPPQVSAEASWVSAHFNSDHGGTHGAAEAPTRDDRAAGGQQSPSKPPACVPPGAASVAPGRGRGRPRGSREGKAGLPYNGNPTAKVIQVTAAASRQARQVKPRPPPTGFPKRRGRPPKPPSPQPREIYCKLSPPFVAFLCEWRGCRAELHNLDTLRRHVNIVHVAETRFTCRWGKCGRKETPEEFESKAALGNHVEKAHLVPFAWHIGDGPKNSSGTQAKPKTDVDTGDGIPGYLKDENGNQVTPSVKDQEVEDFLTWRSNRRRLKELLNRRDENLPDEQSTEPAVSGYGQQPHL